MPKWVNSRIRGQLKERALCPTDEEGSRVLRAALEGQAAAGHMVEERQDEQHGMRWEVIDPSGALVAVYWLSDHDDGAPRP